jgi:hypothetical protein
LILGATDSSHRTLAIENSLFFLDAGAFLYPGGTISLTGGALFGTYGPVLVRGGEVRVSGAAWRIETRLEDGTFVFDGATPNVLGAPAFVATGGDVIWRSADTLLAFPDSTSLSLLGSTVTFETRAVFSPMGLFPATVWLGDLRFFADSVEATSLTLYSMNADVSGTVTIVESSTPSSGAVFDLIRLENGATLTGSPTVGTAGYTLQMNPETGVGLRAIKN